MQLGTGFLSSHAASNWLQESSQSQLLPGTDLRCLHWQTGRRVHFGFPPLQQPDSKPSQPRHYLLLKKPQRARLQTASSRAWCKLQLEDWKSTPSTFRCRIRETLLCSRQILPDGRKRGDPPTCTHFLFLFFCRGPTTKRDCS